MDLSVLLLIVALVCFVLAALAVVPRIPWLPGGLAFFAAGHIWGSLIIAVK